jgi:hypothetical protein
MEYGFRKYREGVAEYEAHNAHQLQAQKAIMTSGPMEMVFINL